LWFAPLLDKNSTLLEDWDDFLIEFNDTFGKSDRIQMATTKIRLLCQASCPALVYAADFYQLACNIDWNDDALINAFWWRIWNDDKDLLLNMPNPLTLIEDITQVVRCGNQLFEHR
jgi:hypothetical protein